MKEDPSEALTAAKRLYTAAFQVSGADVLLLSNLLVRIQTLENDIGEGLEEKYIVNDIEVLRDAMKPLASWLNGIGNSPPSLGPGTENVIGPPKNVSGGSGSSGQTGESGQGNSVCDAACMKAAEEAAALEAARAHKEELRQMMNAANEELWAARAEKTYWDGRVNDFAARGMLQSGAGFQATANANAAYYRLEAAVARQAETTAAYDAAPG